MAYQGRRAKKTPIYKKPGFWAAIGALVLILAMVIWVASILSSDKELIRKPDPTTEPTSQQPGENTEPTEEPTESPLPPNPYTPVDFDVLEDGIEVVLTGGEAVKGIDVSEWQGNINWQKVKDSGVEFVMIRLGGRGTESGEIYSDEYTQRNYEGAIAAGLKVGGYFFSQSITVEEAVEEAQYALEKVKNWDVQMPIAYDWEYVDSKARTGAMDSRTLTDMTKAFCDTIRDAGYETMIYFGRSQSTDMLILEELLDYPFWLAYYTTVMNYPYKVDMWQYTETGAVPGISGNVDMNLLFLYDETE